MNGANSKFDMSRSKNSWVAFHLGSFVQEGNINRDVTSNAISDLCQQFKDGRFRELQITIDVDRDSGRLIVRRWLDQVVLEEFRLSSISNVLTHPVIPGYEFLNNLLSFITTASSTRTSTTSSPSNSISKSNNTFSPMSSSMIYEIHVFQLENLTMVNYLASDIRSAIEGVGNNINKNLPVRVLPSDKASKPQDFEAMLRNEEITSKTERNLLLLNYCFDDIEFFLQHLKDQEDAQSALKSNKHKATDRLLEGKAKPSTQSAYIACIQKIKFSLNLLSKLLGKIRNPDSNELARLLVDNLIKISQAYSIYHNGKLSKIKEPLLTDPTIKLLHNCLNKHHQRQVSNWGEFWIKPREKWNGYKEMYYPEFFNGHQIDLEHLVKDGIINEVPFRPQNRNNNAQFSQNILFNQNKPSLNNGTEISSVVLTQRQEDFCRSVTLRNGKLFRVLSTFSASKDEELSVADGDIVEVVEERPERNWWLCTNMHGDRGFMPKTIIEPFKYVDKSFNNSMNSPKVIRSASAINQSPLNRPSDYKRLSAITNNQNSNNGNGTSSADTQTIQDELKKRLTGPPTSNFGNAAARASFARPGPVVSRKHGQLSINQESTCEDVQKWLRFKKFKESDINILSDFTGQNMFLLTRDQMTRLVGVDVAARLDSLVKVQKSLSGFGTMSKRELEDILLKRKEKVEFVESF